ncbi:hypothetical protein GQ42DRAFT_164604 [Ramicandelaber brevisporus]|nr:hypothetical protein GQ42DRAFT_164604 [Ramicandelaber brevisporus]
MTNNNNQDAAAQHDRILDLLDRKAQLEVLLAEAESLAPLSHNILSSPLYDHNSNNQSAGETGYNDFDHRVQAHQLCGRSLVLAENGSFVTELGALPRGTLATSDSGIQQVTDYNEVKVVGMRLDSFWETKFMEPYHIFWALGEPSTHNQRLSVTNNNDEDDDIADLEWEMAPSSFKTIVQLLCPDISSSRTLLSQRLVAVRHDIPAFISSATIALVGHDRFEQTLRDIEIELQSYISRRESIRELYNVNGIEPSSVTTDITCSFVNFVVDTLVAEVDRIYMHVALEYKNRKSSKPTRAIVVDLSSEERVEQAEQIMLNGDKRIFVALQDLFGQIMSSMQD